MLSASDKFAKRSFDVLFAALGIIFFLWIIFFAWIVASIDTKSNGLFWQKRIGKEGKVFNVYKIKTMQGVEGVKTTVTRSSDVRITKSGAFFRKTKIDELPQLFNVLFGSMSFVGPRPDVSGYADVLEGEDKIILSIRPGITGPASLKYKNEEALLAKQANPENYNKNVIWKDKVQINKKYVSEWSFKKDIIYIIKTVLG